MADTTGRIPLWVIGTVAGILVIGLIGIFLLWFIFRIRFIPVEIG
jgi:photosystem II PsbJ protein